VKTAVLAASHGRRGARRSCLKTSEQEKLEGLFESEGREPLCVASVLDQLEQSRMRETKEV